MALLAQKELRLAWRRRYECNVCTGITKLHCFEGQFWKQSMVACIVQSRQTSISKGLDPKGIVAFDTSESMSRSLP
jgi:hypothetical protein